MKNPFTNTSDLFTIVAFTSKLVSVVLKMSILVASNPSNSIGFSFVPLIIVSALF